MTLLGTGLLWFGWFGFNAGSALAADGVAGSAFVATHLGGMAGMPCRIRDEAGQAAPGGIEGARDIREDRSMAGDHQPGPEGLDEIQRRPDFREGVLALELLEHDAEAVRPERVG